jgi:hypothetical protein
VANGNINFATASTTRGEYTGSRTSGATIADYRTLVNDPSNWTTATGAGNLVLNTTAFTVSAIPEPSTYASIFGVLALAGAALRRRSRK